MGFMKTFHIGFVLLKYLQLKKLAWLTYTFSTRKICPFNLFFKAIVQYTLSHTFVSKRVYFL